MLQEFGESHEGPFTGERSDASPGRHSIETALGELITDPGVSPGLLYTAKALKGRVECGESIEQAQEDAQFLLRWFRERKQQEAAASETAPAKPQPMYDTAAKAAITQKSKADADAYNLLHASADTTVLMYWAPVALQD